MMAHFEEIVGEREGISNADLCCTLLTEGSGKNKRSLLCEDGRGLNDDTDDSDGDDNDHNGNTEVEEGANYDDNKKSRRSDRSREDSPRSVPLDPRHVTSEGVASLIKENESLTSTAIHQLIQLLSKYLV